MQVFEKIIEKIVNTPSRCLDNYSVSSVENAIQYGLATRQNEIIDIIKQVAEEYNNGWIPCSEKLPDEGINPVTRDYYSYKVTVNFGGVLDVKDYKFGNGHWHCGFQIMDDYVIAWMPRPEPYKQKGE